MDDDDNEYYYDETPEGMVICDRCNGDGTVDCMCCGDFCCCGANDEQDCPVCYGKQYITKERWEKRAKAHREIMRALWVEPKLSPDVAATQTYMDGDKVIVREITAEELYLPGPVNVTPEKDGAT